MRRIKHLTCFCLGALLALSCGIADAAEKKADFEAYGLGDLVVTGSKADPRQVAIDTVVTAEDIEANNSKTVAEALRYAPGVVVTTGRKSEPEIQIHGFGQDKMLILIDGVPYYETNYRKLNLDQIPSDIISRIEVIKGAPSVLYGANAEIAVVNVITKKAASEGKPAFALRGEISENNTYRASLTQGIKVDAFNLWFNYTHRESDGFPMSGDYDVVKSFVTVKPGKSYTTVVQDDDKRKNSQYKTDSLWLRMGVEPNEDAEYFVNVHMVNSSRGMAPTIYDNRVFLFRPAFSSFSRFDKYNDFGLDLSGRQGFGDKFSLKGKLFYHEHEDDFVSFSNENYSNAIATSTYKDHFVGGNLIGEFLPAEGHILRASLHYKGDSHKDRDDDYLPFTKSYSYTGSTGLEYQFDGVSNLLVTVGASYDWFDVSEANANEVDKKGDFEGQTTLKTPDTITNLNPMIGASYTFENSATRLFGSVAQKTRFPTLQELYSGRSGNTELDAEKSVNYTLGLNQPIGDTFSFEVAGFYHDISDWISRDGPWVDSKYRNYGKVKVYGAEFGVVYTPITDLKFKVNYTYAHGKDESDGAVTDKVLRLPEHKLDLGLAYLIPVVKVKLNLTGIYVAERYSQLPTAQNPDEEELKDDSYFTANCRFAKDFCKHFEAYFAVNNIMDKDYEPEYGYPAPGRSFWVGFVTRF